MRRLAVLLFFCLPFAILARADSSAPHLIANVSARTTQSLNGHWHYIVDPYEQGLSAHYERDRHAQSPSELIEYDFASSPVLIVPGDWNSLADRLFFYEGPLWYQRTFAFKRTPSKRAFLYFGAANYRARVFLNGEKLGEHEGGFTPFNFEVSNIVKDGDNSIVVEVDNTRHPNDLPALSTDWWNYGGLTRDVTLVELPATFIEDYSVQLAKGSTMQIAGWVQLNGASPADKVTIEIPEAGLHQQVSTDASGRAAFQFAAKLELWSPENPRLYRVTVSSSSDHIADHIGFRTIETRGTQIYLNGKPIFLRGISIHEEAPIRGGRANSDEDDGTLLHWAKELGCNFVRLAHYPHNEGMPRLADQMGLLVWEEIPVYWGIAWENPGTLALAKSQAFELISRDRNRASVVLWSLSNKTPVTATRLDFLKQLAAYERSLDNTRLITSAMNSAKFQAPDTEVLDDPLGEILDVMGVNEYIGWYTKKPEEADNIKWKFAYEKPVIVSEFGGGALAGRHGDAQARWTEEYQANLYDHQLRMLQQIPELAGVSPWLLMDFHSPRRQLPGIQDYYNRKGLISNQGQKKLAFSTLQEFYRKLAATKK